MNMLKKQGVAWAITAVMIVAAIGISQAKGHRGPAPNPPFTDGKETSVPVPQETLHVYDDARVLSDSAKRELGQRNLELYNSLDVVIACVTTRYGRDDLDRFALNYAERINLGPYDFIVVLDISGDNYWLVQGSGLSGLFTDDDCAAYAWDYMERSFALGDYDGALLNLTQGLREWYRLNYY